MTDQEAEIEYWRNACAYLASCHAATAEYDGKLSTTSKARAKRYADICRTAVRIFNKHWVPTISGASKPLDAQQRCEDAMRSLGYND